MGSPKLLRALLLHSPQDVRNLNITRRLCGIYTFKERNNKNVRFARFEVHAVLLLKYHVFWGLIHCHINGSQNFGLIMVLWNIINQKAQMSQCAMDINHLMPTGYMLHQQVQHSTTVRSAHTVFVCFVFIWEQTATCATYSTNWLVFIIEMKSVYSAVWTGSLNKAVCASSVKG